MLIWFEENTGRVVAYNSAMSDSELKKYNDESPETTMFVDDLPEKPDDFENPVLFVDLETKSLTWVDEYIEPEVEPFDNEVAMLELLSMTEYNTCLLEMQMEF